MLTRTLGEQQKSKSQKRVGLSEFKLQLVCVEQTTADKLKLELQL
jgi:hypothetical protein